MLKVCDCLGLGVKFNLSFVLLYVCCLLWVLVVLLWFYLCGVLMGDMSEVLSVLVGEDVKGFLLNVVVWFKV